MKHLIFLLMLCLVSCKQSTEKQTTETPVTAKEADPHPPQSWVEKRVSKAQQSLQASEAGQIVWQAMQAHGGLANYLSNGYLKFQFNYQPLKNGTGRNTIEIVDTWSNQVRHHEADNADMQYGWNGKVAWEVTPDGNPYPYDTRFWALTPYYFLGLPFVLDGQGVILEKQEDRVHKNKPQDVVRVTFEDGTGDAPDDYYLLYFDKTTHLLSVIRYAVSYPGYFPKGKYGNERFMEVTAYQTTQGITLPEAYKAYMSQPDGNPGEYVTLIEVSGVEFIESVPEGFFNPPQGSRLVEITPVQ